MKAPTQHHGIALLVVLLIVTLTTLAITAMIARQHIDIYRTANLLNHEQAYLYALGAESWVKRILLRDRRENHNDNLNELWATRLPPFPIPGGTLQAHVEDLQGRFNLNNLLLDNGQINTKEIERFERLLTLLELPTALAQTTIDWIDNDKEVHFPAGAEDDHYLLKTPPYRAANQRFTTPTEVSLLAGLDKDDYHKLLPYITTLPEYTPINVNTTSPLLLRILVEELNASEATTLAAKIKEHPFKSTQDFLTDDALAGLKVAADALSVSSNYFLFTAQVHIDRGKAQLSSLLYRSSKKDEIKVILRSQGEW
jgi:general secretion pathway protein K